MSPNMYEHLDHLDDAVITGTNNERRKAEKKLKEIQTLLKKTSHTKEELDKLATEQHWKDIIDWIDNPKKMEETQKTIKNRLKRKREKEKRERELEEIRKRREKEAEEQKRRHEEIRKQRQQREKEAEEQKRRYQEDRKQKRQEEEEFRKRQEEEFREHQELWSEFDAMYRQNNDVNKTFRKLSVKYHPDKNIGKKQWSEAKQQELTNIRDHYSSKYSIE